MSVLLGGDILGHILEQDSDLYRAEELADDDDGLAGDLSEEDVADLLRTKHHEAHLGIVFRHNDKHPLNDRPNDYLSPYKLKSEQ